MAINCVCFVLEQSKVKCALYALIAIIAKDVFFAILVRSASHVEYAQSAKVANIKAT